jgi:hypothetical protein
MLVCLWVEYAVEVLQNLRFFSQVVGIPSRPTCSSAVLDIGGLQVALQGQ